MGLTVVLYLAFNFFYSAVITEPHQQDIAKGFGAIPIQILLIVIAAPVDRGDLLPRHALRRAAGEAAADRRRR